jgi:hypothetical protein
VIQDVLTLHGSQFKNASLIVASPPCQEYSYMAMPWKRAKQIAHEYRTGVRDVKQLTALFDACFRIQREAIEAAGRHIPLVVENVRGAIPWVGRSRWNYGSFHLWGDVPALMPLARSVAKRPGHDWNRFKESGEVSPHWRLDGDDSLKAPGGPRKGRAGYEGVTPRLTNPAEHYSDDVGGSRLAGKHAVDQDTGKKIGGDWFSDPQSTSRKHGSRSKGRKMASAMIAKIPLPISRHIGRVYSPVGNREGLVRCV